LSARRFAPCQHGASRLVSTALRALSARSGFQPSLVSTSAFQIVLAEVRDLQSSRPPQIALGAFGT
jgi:hypothetical protein